MLRVDNCGGVTEAEQSCDATAYKTVLNFRAFYRSQRNMVATLLLAVLACAAAAAPGKPPADLALADGSLLAPGAPEREVTQFGQTELH